MVSLAVASSVEGVVAALVAIVVAALVVAVAPSASTDSSVVPALVAAVGAVVTASVVAAGCEGSRRRSGGWAWAPGRRAASSALREVEWIGVEEKSGGDEAESKRGGAVEREGEKSSGEDVGRGESKRGGSEE